ncbi:MAG: hypothetical protein QW521_02955 [Desulfurococcaceae archaeon]
MSSIHRAVALSPEDFIKESIGIVERAEKKGVILRILGACAIYIHSLHEPKSISIYTRLGRLTGHQLFTDLDLVGYSKQRKDVIKFFEEELKFKYDPLIKALFANRRLIYYHPLDLYYVDVFFDKLEFNHDIVFGDKPGKGRLELDYPTIALEDIVLEKLQITKINQKDLVDLTVLLHGHDLCSTSREKECIDGGYIATILSNDWGFWYDATTNLGRLLNFINSKVNEGKLSASEKEIIESRVNKLLNMVNEKPKTKNWIKRSIVGVSKPWYREVEEVVR